MTEQLGHERHALVVNTAGSICNGRNRKTHKGEFSELPVVKKVPGTIPGIHP